MTVFQNGADQALVQLQEKIIREEIECSPYDTNYLVSLCCDLSNVLLKIQVVVDEDS